MTDTILDLLRLGQPTAPAVTAPGRRPLTYGDLLEQVERVGAQLRASGIGRNDRVAIILPNGPELATTFGPRPTPRASPMGGSAPEIRA